MLYLLILSSGDFLQVAHIFSAYLLSLSCSLLLKALKAKRTQNGSGGSPSIVSHKILKPTCFVTPPYCYLSPVHTQCRARRNAVLSLANNDNKKHQQKLKGQTRLSYLPWTYNAPAYLTLPLHFNPTVAPLPCQECWGTVTFSPKCPILVSQED